ncbi:MAG: 3-oxoacyl-[acyl-carrier-protein] reductase [Gammaproteobacteria bacterium]|nr:3-oxoacyl-[acyl-carrier-protein] reductase [Gammaproteobacteria bacterium]
MLLKNKKAIVTGGAAGIGRQIVMTFLENGASVYFIDLNESKHLQEMEECAKKNGCQVFFKQANVADEEGISAVINEILDESDGIDILVNNAGITRDNLIFRMSSSDWDSVLKINLTSVFYISKIVARHMAKRKGGSIINMASIVGIGGNPGQTNYSASKAGLIGFTKSLAKEIAVKGVRVNAIAPGFIATEMTDKLSDEVIDNYLNVIPLKRLGTPKDIANASLFLASDLSSYITARVIQVDGGILI